MSWSYQSSSILVIWLKGKFREYQLLWTMQENISICCGSCDLIILPINMIEIDEITTNVISEIRGESEHRDVLGSNRDRYGEEPDKAGSYDKTLPESGGVLSEL